jgi:hypothetical protein
MKRRHHAARRYCGAVAARGARAAGDYAGDLVVGDWETRGLSFCTGTETTARPLGRPSLARPRYGSSEAR